METLHVFSIFYSGSGFLSEQKSALEIENATKRGIFSYEDTSVEREELNWRVRQIYFSTLSLREQKVIYNMLCEKPISEVAKDLGISEERAQQILLRAKRKLRIALRHLI